jgi:hypothetical protein
MTISFPSNPVTGSCPQWRSVSEKGWSAGKGGTNWRKGLYRVRSVRQGKGY